MKCKPCELVTVLLTRWTWNLKFNWPLQWCRWCWSLKTVRTTMIVDFVSVDASQPTRKCVFVRTHPSVCSFYLHGAVAEELLDVFSHTGCGHALRIGATDVPIGKSEAGEAAVRRVIQTRLELMRFTDAPSCHSFMNEWQQHDTEDILNFQWSHVTHRPLSRASASSTSRCPSTAWAAHKPRTHTLCLLDFTLASRTSSGFCRSEELLWVTVLTVFFLSPTCHNDIK